MDGLVDGVVKTQECIVEDLLAGLGSLSSSFDTRCIPELRPAHHELLGLDRQASILLPKIPLRVTGLLIVVIRLNMSLYYPAGGATAALGVVGLCEFLSSSVEQGGTRRLTRLQICCSTVKASNSMCVAH